MWQSATLPACIKLYDVVRMRHSVLAYISLCEWGGNSFANRVPWFASWWRQITSILQPADLYRDRFCSCQQPGTALSLKCCCDCWGSAASGFTHIQHPSRGAASVRKQDSRQRGWVFLCSHIYLLLLLANYSLVIVRQVMTANTCHVLSAVS